MTPAVHALLARRAEVPAWVRRHLDRRRDDGTRRALALTRALLDGLDAFARAGIPVLALKGPALAQRLHGDVGVRDYDDLDLLVRPRDVAGARATLAELGYVQQDQLPVHWERDVARRLYVLLYRHPRTQVEIDLHWRWDPHVRDGEDVWSGARRIACGGREIPTPGDEALLVYLCVHGARHAWSRLAWIRDVAALLESRAWSGASLTRRARRAGAAKMLAFGVQLAHDVLGAPLPVRVAPETARLAARTRRDLFREEGALAAGWRRAALLWNLLDSAERAAFSLGRVRRLVTPTRADRAWVALPERLDPLYYAVRPLRLLLRGQSPVPGVGTSAARSSCAR